MREKAIECIDRRADESDFALTPALVFPQDANRSHVLLLTAGIEYRLCEGGGIQQTEIHALTRKRMHDVGRIANERTSLRHVAVRSEPTQRK